MNTDTYLSVSEFSALLRVPRSTIYDAIAAGRLEHRKVGGTIRIHRDAGIVTAAPKRAARRQPVVVLVRNQRKAAS